MQPITFPATVLAYYIYNNQERIDMVLTKTEKQNKLVPQYVWEIVESIIIERVKKNDQK